MSIEAMKQALEALEGFIALTNDSQGVNGYHLNGDIAEWNEFDEVDKATEAITALRTAIEQADKSQDIKSGIETVAAQGGLLPQQEPVTQCSYPRCQTSTGGTGDCSGVCSEIIRTTPPAAQREWVGLTDDDIKELWDVWKDALCLDLKTWAFAIEAKLKEKNA